MRKLRGWVLGAAVMLVTGAQAQEAQVLAVDPNPPAGAYTLDLTHGRLIFKVSHLGFSNYTAFFRDFSADLAFDPANPAAMSVATKVKAASVETLFSDPGVNFNALIAGPEFLDAAQFPEITFVSTAVLVTGEKTAIVTGDLTLHGVTKPVALDVTYNGGWAGHPMDPGGARVGFSAKGSLKRSDFGITYGLPTPGSTLGVGDTVQIEIEAEFINPAAPKPEAPAPQG